MYYVYNGININYEVVGNNEPIILLHGWGTNLETFSNLKKDLSISHKVYLIDLPGFGKSDEPEIPFSLNDYCNLLNELIDKIVKSPPIILGHSFGGRIAIKYASQHKVKKLILVDSAGIKQRLSLSNRFKILKFKLMKKIYSITKNEKLKKIIDNSGSQDYRNASKIMKETMVKVINENLKANLKKIDVETLIIWGKDDRVTPLQNGKLMYKKIKKSGLVIIPDCGHFPYLEKPHYFRIILEKFLEVQDDF